MEVFILLLADVVALLSTPTGLQNQLHCLKTCCQQMKMEVNEDKKIIMVFTIGGFMARHDLFYFNF